MTAQIGDKYTFNGENYTIVAMSESVRFNPRQFGIMPASACTACWAGYWCCYNVTEDGLFLNDLYINSFDNTYPPINDVLPLVDERSGEYVDYMGHHVYKDLNLKVKYTGKILLGGNFISRYYIHMGFQRAWAYEELKELVFEDGTLVEVNDQSHIAAEIREKLNGNKDFPSHSVKDFVDDSFSLDYKKKAWWL